MRARSRRSHHPRTPTRSAARSPPSARGGMRPSTICTCACRLRTAASPASSASRTPCSRPRARCRSICSSRSRSTASRRTHRVLNVRRDGNAFFAIAARSAKDRRAQIRHRLLPRQAEGRAPSTVGRRLHLDPATRSAIAGSPPPTRDSAPASGGPTRTRRPTSPTASASRITVPDSMIDVSNGRLRSTTHNTDGTTTYEWFVTSPINNYDVAVNAGTYAHYSRHVRRREPESSRSTSGRSPIISTPRRSSGRRCSPMLACFEHWFGPYPWYADGYKLVEAPHLGMEHQSAVAYGNHFHNGYLGRDLSHTGLGLGWDFIIVHESAHEWFGNSITTKDIADIVGARRLRELRRVAVRGVQGWQGGGRALRDRRTRRTSRTTRRSSSQYGAESRRLRATCTTRAATCSTPSARS